MSVPLYFITGNKDKFAEAKAVLGELEQLDIDLPEIQSIDCREVVETKLLEAQKHHQGQLIVEDTALHLNCLNGLPGALFKWFFKAMGAKGVVELAHKLKDSKAQVRTVVGYSDQSGDVRFFEGLVKGKVALPRGVSGFGWDPIFQPEGFDQTYAEVSDEEKEKLGMDKPRKVALQKLKEYLDGRD